MGWTVRVFESQWEKRFSFLHTGIGIHPISSTVGTVAISWECSGRAVAFDHPAHSSSEITSRDPSMTSQHVIE